MIAPVFNEISSDIQNQNVLFVKVDIDKNPEIASRYQVRSMPTFLFLRNRKEIDRFSGADVGKLKEKNSFHEISLMTINIYN